MPAARADELLATPHGTALAPLLYVAWADGSLDDGEMKALCAAASRADVADPRVAAWLDPAAPPSSTELLRLHRTMRERVGELDAGARKSIADLGLALAGGGDDATTQALHEMEAVLGTQGSEVVRELFAPRPTTPDAFAEPDSELDAEAMRGVLDGAWAEEWQAVRKLLEDERFRDDGRQHDMDHFRERVAGWVRHLAAEGYGALGYPESTGGRGRMDRFLKCFEALGIFDLNLVVKFGVQFGLFGGAILNLGSEAHHEALLPAVGRGEHFGGFAMTERGHGSNVRDIETVARYDAARDLFVVHTPSASARKEYIGNGAKHGRTMVVFAQLEVGGVEHGVHALVVPVRDEDGAPLAGVTIEDCGPKMGLNGIDNGRLGFDHVEVPRSALLDRYGRVTDDGVYESPIASDGRRFFTMLATLVGGRIGVGSSAVSASKTCLAIAIRYAALRRQFGPGGGVERTILDYPAHAERLLPRLAGTYALHFAVDHLQAQWREQTEESARQVETLAAGLKAIATWHAIDTAQQCRECCGGAGYLAVQRVCEIRKDVDVFATFEGDNVVLLQLVAKGLLSDYAKAFSSDLVGTLMRSIARRASSAVFEQNPFTARWSGEGHLREADFHSRAFAFRTDDLMRSAAARMKKRIDAKQDAFDAVVEVQAHLVDLATAWAEQQVHEAFRRAVESTAAGPEREALESMRCLYAVWRLQEGIAWFLENGYVEPNKARALRKLVSTLCREVRPMAVPLVDAFGIPDAVLAAPIAFPGYASA